MFSKKYIIIIISFSYIGVFSQTDSVIIKSFPEKFKFVDYNNDGSLQTSEIDFIISTYLDNSRKYPKALLNEFVLFYNERQQKQKIVIDSTLSTIASNTITPKKIEQPKDKPNKLGIAVLPVGSEFAVGTKYNITNRSTVELRLTKPNYTLNPTGKTGYSFVTELIYVHRVVAKPKVKFNVGLGARADYALNSNVENFRYGAVVPISVEAFPFAAIPNGALFFEVAPIFTLNADKSQLGLFRSASGFCIYF